MRLQNPLDLPSDTLLFMSEEPGDAVVIERELIVVETDEGSTTIGTQITMTDCRTGEERMMKNYL